MCWVTKNKVEKKIASEDIIVYKVVRKGCLSSFRSPYQCTPIEVGKTLVASDGFFDEIEGDIKNEGMHAYWKDEILVARCNLVYFFLPMGNPDWDTFNDYWPAYSETFLAKCIIPAGAVYFLNERGEVVSEKLIVTDNIIPMNEAYKTLVMKGRVTIEDFFWYFAKK